MLWEAVEAVEDWEAAGGGIYEGERMETNIEGGLRGVQTEWSDIMATRVEEDVNCYISTRTYLSYPQPACHRNIP